jgi:hypothetical protein
MTVQVNIYSTECGSEDLELHETRHYADASVADDASKGFWYNNAATMETWTDVFLTCEREEFNGWIWDEEDDESDDEFEIEDFN